VFKSLNSEFLLINRVDIRKTLLEVVANSLKHKRLSEVLFDQSLA
jgi:hypothetical protein